MKIRLLLVVLLIFVNITLIRALESDKELEMPKIIEIDNILSRNKARNTSNPTIIEIEQAQEIYLHYIKDCRVNFTTQNENTEKMQIAQYTLMVSIIKTRTH